jgi:leader peptidase (prepilin peptidase)/N-methyltransferase
MMRAFDTSFLAPAPPVNPLDTSPLLAQLVAAWVVFVGACLGSFLNVVIARVPAGASIVRPGSRCPRCGTPIRWYDNIPVLSWILLRARCRTCRAPISVRYPAVELLGAGAAWLALTRHGLSAAAAAEVAFALLLVALSFIDLDTWLLPHALTWPLIAAGLLAAALGVAPAASIRASALGALVGFAGFAAVAVVGKRLAGREALGFGDVWLLAGIGAWLGVAALLPVVLLASVQGAVVGLALIALGRAQPGPRPDASSPDAPSPEVPPQPPPEGAPPGAEATAPHPAEPAAEPPSTSTPTSTSAPAPAPEAPSAEPAADAEDPDADWVPPRNAIPFGPFLAAAALEWLYLSGAIARLVPMLGVFR